VSPETQAQGGPIHERRRAEIAATVPSWYSPALHLVLPALLGLGTMAGALLSLRDLRPLELLAVPATMLLATPTDEIRTVRRGRGRSARFPIFSAQQKPGRTSGGRH